MNAIGLLPADPTLPHLAQAMDDQAMAEVFGDTLRGHGAHIDACHLERIKYRPRRNCTLSYRLRLRRDADGAVFEQHVSARLCSSGGEAARRVARASAAPLVPSVAGPALRLLPVLDMLTWWWPNDARLKAPRWLADEERLRCDALEPLVAMLSQGRGRLLAHDVQLVQYVPEHRLTARARLHWREGGLDRDVQAYAKASHEPEGRQVHDMLAALQASAAWQQGRLRTPSAWAWQPASGLHWQQAMAGQPWIELDDRQQRARSATLGEQLAALHATPLELLRVLEASALRQQLAQVADVLAQALPEAADDLQRAVGGLARRLDHMAALPPATLHGDLHPRNILVHGDQVGLIDLDGLRRGPAVLELGAWAADAAYRAALAGQPQPRDAMQALMEGYVQGGGQRPAAQDLDWATAWALLTQRAWRCVVNLKPGRLAVAPRLVALAAERVA